VLALERRAEHGRGGEADPVVERAARSTPSSRDGFGGAGDVAALA